MCLSEGVEYRRHWETLSTGLHCLDCDARFPVGASCDCVVGPSPNLSPDRPSGQTESVKSVEGSGDGTALFEPAAARLLSVAGRQIAMAECALRIERGDLTDVEVRAIAEWRKILARIHQVEHDDAITARLDATVAAAERLEALLTKGSCAIRADMAAAPSAFNDRETN